MSREWFCLPDELSRDSFELIVIADLTKFIDDSELNKHKLILFS